MRSLASGSQNPLLNQEIRAVPKVRLISEKGDDLGIMSGAEALRHAMAANKDVMQVSQSETPVVRVLDYATHEEAKKKKDYERRKARKESARKQKKETMMKQVRLSPSTDTNDMMIKMRKARDFLMDGYRVKVYMQFRRGQGRLSENAKKALVNAAEHLSTFGNVQGVPSGGLKDLFKPKQDEEVEETGHRPLIVMIQPFARKAREQMLKEFDEADSATPQV